MGIQCMSHARDRQVVAGGFYQIRGGRISSAKIYREDAHESDSPLGQAVSVRSIARL